MNATRLRECLDLIGWTQRNLSRLTNRQEGAVRMWARDALPVPVEVATWLEKVANFHELNPPPPHRERHGIELPPYPHKRDSDTSA